MERIALVLRHVHFEDLGSFAAPLKDAGFKLRYSDVADDDFCKGDPLFPDLLIILGGPVGVYELVAYPFIALELAFIENRLASGQPTLGICLGAQLMASALGSKVVPSGLKEIGYSELNLTADGYEGPLRHLAGVAVLHWHGDTYELPGMATNLASTELFEQQAFAVGTNVLALQFHPEAELDHRFERWLVGHAAELSAANVNPVALRQSGIHYGPRLRSAAAAMLTDWVHGLRPACRRYDTAVDSDPAPARDISRN